MALMLQESVMNQDLIQGARVLGKGKIRHVHAESGRRLEV